MPKNDKKFVGVDIGTTTIRACLFDSSYHLIDYCEEKIQIICDSSVELVEIDPEVLWNQFCNVILSVVEKVADPLEIIAVGLCCQRNTFISWNNKNLTPCHRLITWKDGRGKAACEKWNKSYTLKAINMGAALLYYLTGIERFKAAKELKFVNSMVTQRFLVTLEQNNEMQQLLSEGHLAVGCLDTWLISRLTNGKAYITELSCASSTGFFDPFLENWNSQLLRIIGFPKKILFPEILDTTKINVTTDPSVLNGISLTIKAMLGDAQSAVFGSGCSLPNSLCVSLGTGTFVDYIISAPCFFVSFGLYPLVAWRAFDNTKFCIEGHANNTASLLNWAQSLGFFDNFENLSKIAESTEPDATLFFIPGFDGIQTPLNDEHACAAFIGLKATSTREQMLHAVLSSIAFTVCQIFDQFKTELSSFKVSTIRCCGGVSNNDFICQSIANLLNFSVERVQDNDLCAAKGVAMMAAIAAGELNNDDAINFIKVQQTFFPSTSAPYRQALLNRYTLWKNAQNRCLNFYK